MKRCLLMTTLFCSFFFVCYSSAYAQAAKIAVFDIQKVMRESKKVQNYRAVLEKEIMAKRKLIAEKQDAIVVIEEKFKKDGDRIPLDERKRLQEKHANEMKELKRLREDIDLELKKIDRELTQRAIIEIGDVIRNLADKENYSVVFEKNTAGVVFLKESFNITGKIIEAYDGKK